MRLIKKPPLQEFQANEPMFATLIPGDGLLLQHLERNLQETKGFILAIPAGKLTYRYLPDKWTIKEIIVHMADMERIYAYRMLSFARNEKAKLPGFDDRQYVFHAGANDRAAGDLLTELETVRAATITLLNGIPEEGLLRTSIINGHAVSVRALAYHIAGHELHHRKVIREKYLL